MSSSTSNQSDSPDVPVPAEHRPGTLSASSAELYERALERRHPAAGASAEACVVVELQRPGVVDLAAKQRLLEDLARRLGIDVRYEPLAESARWSSKGGLCRIRSHYVILVHARATQAEQVGVLLDALAQPELKPLLDTLAIRLELQRLVP